MEHTVPYIFILRIENNYMNISSNGQMIFFKMMWKSSYAYSKSSCKFIQKQRFIITNGILSTTTALLFEDQNYARITTCVIHDRKGSMYCHGLVDPFQNCVFQSSLNVLY